ncbi:hypothetical protein C8J56DRAFT_926421 [Mycena floridula]|nr:hypothetical protein C8J56DRAFT_926421 [Mycena floridula]
MDDDDEFLYGGSTTASQSTALEKSLSTNSLSHQPEQEEPEPKTDPEVDFEADDDDAQVDAEDSEEEEEDDIEIIMEPTAKSIDFRQNPPGRPSQNRSLSSSLASRGPQSSLTTEYTPIQRGDSAASLGASSSQLGQSSSSSSIPASSSAPQIQPAAAPVASHQPPQNAENTSIHDGIDLSALPVATAPPSHPVIDPTAVGTVDGRPILEVDLSAMTEKNWRRPGSDISDWFNYGFDEISWEAYCYRRRDLGEMANVLKTNVLNFSGMNEDQVTALPPEVRQMVMTGTSAMMNNGANGGMMPSGVMMDMSGMMPMGMGMNGEMGMMPLMGDGVGPGSGTPEQGMLPDSYGAMNMSGEYSMQEQQQMFDAPTPVAPAQGPRNGATTYRGRVMPGLRGGRGFSARGRGRGGAMYTEGGPAPPVRAASPLPPGVPTGPRNQNKYKDRDGNAPAVDGLDYGGGNGGPRTSSGEPEDRGSSRKRRGSPSMDDRSSKRR